MFHVISCKLAVSQITLPFIISQSMAVLLGQQTSDQPYRGVIFRTGLTSGQTANTQGLAGIRILDLLNEDVNKDRSLDFLPL